MLSPEDRARWRRGFCLKDMESTCHPQSLQIIKSQAHVTALSARAEWTALASVLGSKSRGTSERDGIVPTPPGLLSSPVFRARLGQGTQADRVLGEPRPLLPEGETEA